MISCGCSLNLYSKRGILPLVGGHTFPFSFLLGTGTLAESPVTWTISPWWSYQFPTPLQKSCSLLFLLVPLHDESKETQWNFKASFFCFWLLTCLLILERKQASEKERERNIDVREKQWVVAYCTCRLGTKLTSQACAQTRNWTSALSPCSMMPHLPSPIHWLPFLCALTGDWSCNPSILGWHSNHRCTSQGPLISWLLAFKWQASEPRLSMSWKSQKNPGGKWKLFWVLPPKPLPGFSWAWPWALLLSPLCPQTY